MNIKDFIQNIIKEEMQSLREDDVVQSPGGNWGQSIPELDDDPQPSQELDDEIEIINQFKQLLSTVDPEDAVEILNNIADEAGLTAPEKEPIGFREGLNEAKGLATARVAQHGLDTAPSAMDDAHRAVVDAGGYNSPGMMRLMRTIAQAARGMNLSPQETLELAQSMLDADMLKTAENDPTGSLEEDATRYERDEQGRLKGLPRGPGDDGKPSVPRPESDEAKLQRLKSELENTTIPNQRDRIKKEIAALESGLNEAVEGEPPLQGQELRDALHSDISDMFKDMNGIRPRWINFQAMSMEELENLHHLTNQQHRDWHNQERVEDDLDDINYEKELRNAMQHDADVENARLDAIEAETERMREPEEGEEQAKQSGMGRRYNPGKLREAKSWSSYGNAKTLFEGWRKFTEE